MTKSKAAATIVMWISIGAMFSVSVVACQRYNTAINVKNAELRQLQWEGQRADCNAHDGMLVKGWTANDWSCEGAKR
ncbi:hypothetical protein [Rhizobium rhizogenes]|uniref:hypothetical protein n=1 Tax=Rhizobium rhizogenes TaxID=359 RepID=UPI0024BF08FC|nr:hypothetical protein [Rhizobium rhizogenes]MDJ1632306.1 hypothetical protein [Rhizobium rhizogenes]